jgi:hypothetical protein
MVAPLVASGSRPAGRAVRLVSGGVHRGADAGDLVDALEQRVGNLTGHPSKFLLGEVMKPRADGTLDIRGRAVHVGHGIG